MLAFIKKMRKVGQNVLKLGDSQILNRGVLGVINPLLGEIKRNLFKLNIAKHVFLS